MIIKLESISDKDKISKTTREKRQITYERIVLRLISDFLS